MTKEGSTKIVHFMTPGTGVLVLGSGHISHIVKLHYFSNNLLLYTPRQRSNKLIVYYSNHDQGRVYQNCKFHISLYSEYVLSSSLSVYFTLIAIVLKDCNAGYNGAVDMQICALLTRIQCKVTDTQVTVKACGPLVESCNRLLSIRSQYVHYIYI